MKNNKKIKINLYLTFNTIIKILILLYFFVYSFNLESKEKVITIASTTSTHDTGLLKSINKEFTKKYNIKVNILALGTGQAIRVAKDGNVEILLVHHTPSEMKFMTEGYGNIRHNLMYNDYVLVGPKADTNECFSIEDKLFDIKNNRLNFISRGDDSGTHKKEKELWNLINVKINNLDNWYLSVGQGMGETLLIANNKKSYTLSDRSSWISFNKKDNLKIVCENFPPLFNQYGIILVKENLDKNLNISDAETYINWIISENGKELINNFKQNGKQLFFFNHN